MLDLTLIGLATAFAGGMISFLSPCVLPLVPGYLSYVAGTGIEELRDDRVQRMRALFYASWFVLGFSLVFIAMGASATALGYLLLGWRYELGMIAGVVVILFGLHMVGLTPFGAMNREFRIHLELPGGKAVTSFVLGLAFAFGWTPCIGPVLGAILTMSASSAHIETGALLLAVYSAGLGLPFLVAALFTGSLLGRMRHLGRAGYRLQQGAGVLLIAMGLLMVTGRLEMLAFWLLETFPAFQYIG